MKKKKKNIPIFTNSDKKSYKDCPKTSQRELETKGIHFNPKDKHSLANMFHFLVFVKTYAGEYNAICDSLDNIFCNEKRKKIYQLIQKKPIHIQEISKKVKLSYINTFAHIKLLEKRGLIISQKAKETQGQKVFLYPSNKSIDTLKKELKEKAILKLYEQYNSLFDVKTIKEYFNIAVEEKEFKKNVKRDLDFF